MDKELLQLGLKIQNMCYYYAFIHGNEEVNKMELKKKEQKSLETVINAIGCPGDIADQRAQEKMLSLNVEGYNTESVYRLYQEKMKQYGVKVGMFQGNTYENYN